VEQYFVNIKQELSYRKPLPILRQRSKSSGLVDNVIAESRRPFSWCVALYFRVLPVHFSKYKNSIKTNIIKQKLNYLLKKKHSKLVFVLDHTPPPKMRVPPAISAGFGSRLPRADVDKRKTSLEIVPISKISNSRRADQKYKLNCNGKAIMYRAKSLNNHDAARPAVIGILEKDKITATTIPITMPGNACNFVVNIKHRHLPILNSMARTCVRIRARLHHYYRAAAISGQRSNPLSGHCVSPLQ
ncbi:hypothetical protein J6590_105766, partial [Homalodisca vitripennis]